MAFSWGYRREASNDEKRSACFREGQTESGNSKAGNRTYPETFICDTPAGGRYGYSVLQELLGHASSKTTEIYTHVSIKDIRRIQSPLDRM